MSAEICASLQAAAILTGDRDAELTIERAQHTRGQPLENARAHDSLAHTLQRRLDAFATTHAFSYAHTELAARGVCVPCDTTGTHALQRTTGWYALWCIEMLHTSLLHTSTVAPDNPQPAPQLSTRNLAMLKQLISMCFAWLIVPLTDQYDTAYAEMYPAMASTSIVELPTQDTAERTMIDLAAVAHVFALLFHKGTHDIAHSALPLSSTAQTDIAVLLQRVYLADVLRVLIRLAYGPSPESGKNVRETAREELDTVLGALPTMTALGALRSVPLPSALSQRRDAKRAPRIPPFVRTQSGRLLSMQLLRPEGVRSLLIGMLGANENDMLSGDIGDEVDEGDTSFMRLDGVTRLLTVPPKSMLVRAYYLEIIPHVLSVLDPVVPPGVTPVHGMHRRAAAFTLMRMVERDADAVAQALHAPLFDVLGKDATQADEARVDRALRLLGAAVLLAPPSPDLLDFLVSPLVVRLLSLDTFLRRADANRVVPESERRHTTQLHEVDNVLHTWIRLAPTHSTADALIHAVAASLAPTHPFQWQLGAHGAVLVEGTAGVEHLDLQRLLQYSSLSLDQLSKQLNADDTPTLPTHLVQSLDFCIDPARISTLLHEGKRMDIGSAVLLAALEQYGRTQTQSMSHLTVGDTSVAELERRSVYYLQMVGQLFDVFGPKLLEGDIDRVLHFIDFACSTCAKRSSSEQRNALDTLMHIQDEASMEVPEHDNELLTTALNLFLSLLEGHPELTLATVPMLQVLLHKIEPMRDAASEELRALSQEVVLLLSARHQAQTTINAPSRPKYMDVYHEALQYLQDPILPVRAYGLTLLAQLVSKDTAHHGQVYGTALDPALLPAIFDLLVHAVQDDESFLYLNAVKGLAQMTAHWREAVLQPLVAIYVGGDKSNSQLARALHYGQQLTQRETDKRLRIGEALLQVLQFCGEAIAPMCTFPSFSPRLTSVPIFVQPLLTAVRNPMFSASLRSSFISILGTCIEILPLAMATSGASREIVALCKDLVALEMVHRPVQPLKKSKVCAHVSGMDTHGDTVMRQVDSDDSDDERLAQMEREQRAGIDTDPKLPQLRRSALLLLAVMLRATRHQLDAFMEAQRSCSMQGASLSQLRLPGGSMLPDTGGGIPKQVAPPTPLVSMAAAHGLITVVLHAAQEDVDEVVRQQAQDCVEEERLLEAAYAQAHMGGASLP
ncbi:hypothetical protein MVES1_000271 [Malassezia vespertilionis]|uniref:RNA polymerase II assembly factor Rtp1 C-terminal domain-containing protein n=1 Tax=Malassezia vespertilionis TaxID=2020962 RepID=A0A2N1JGR6_9BASI|nr:uncharacterized protein MVES1_000271 [Malassezia vespertilionis]PKI85735.1 hypothetical protein MVES_000256 [Malassezia vespertilionis]WFD04946.1 hypothetical protein MVES1_000271 [Malassezia vespertilionis]